MPEQSSARGNSVTSAAIEAPFESPTWPFGMGGLNLADALDALQIGEYARLTNAYFTPSTSRQMTARPGQTPVTASAGTDVHSIVRMNDILDDDWTRFWGVDTTLFRGQSGALTPVDAGYSGDPLTLVTHRATLSGDPWLFVGDAARVRKIRFDGLSLEIGLAAPVSAVTTGLGAQQSTVIEAFTGGGWTGNPGWDFSSPPNQTNTPITIVTDTFLTNPSTVVLQANTGFYNFWGKPVTLNLAKVGSADASDEDIMQVAIQFANAALVAEVRLYAVCSATFSSSVLPGASVDSAGNPVASGVNDNFFMKAFRPDDFTAVVQSLQSQIATAETARVNAIRQQALQTASNNAGFARLAPQHAGLLGTVPRQAVTRANTTFAASQDPVRNQSVVAGGAHAQYVHFGTIGIPLRRGDWKRYGSTAGRDWDTITGIIVYIQAAPFPTALPGMLNFCSVSFQTWQLTGGSGPDTMDPAAQSYDHRYTHYDPRTGAESNPSPEMDEGNFLDALRRAIQVNVLAYGDSAVRQRVYRRGGTLLDNWYFCGENDGDGSAFTDALTDSGIESASTVAIDHYQPVATVNDAGDTILAQPVPVLIGPYNGMLFALGDPYRPGHVYGCLPDEPDHWPADLICEVCSPSEELMNGFLYGGQVFVYSREREYVLYANPGGASGALTITSAPTGWAKGLAGRWALTVGLGNKWIVALDGIYRVGDESPISADIKPLFQGQSVNGYAPIDFTVATALRLEIFEQELFFSYQDTQGASQTLVFQILTQRWRHYHFAHATSALYPEEVGGASTLLLGGRTTGVGYTHTGDSDAGTAIAVTARTGAWDFSRPREEKLFGDQTLDVDTQGVELFIQNFLNTETVTNPLQSLTAAAGRKRAIMDSFGVIPQRARNISTEITWASAVASPVLYFLTTAITMQPDLTINRVTNWDDLGRPDESYVTGITLDCDTGGTDRTILIERDFGGSISVIATLTVNANGRHKLKFTWAAQPCNMVRIQPDDTCAAWILYRADWISAPEPPRIAGWDIHFENTWDQYYTGVDLYCDTFGAAKTVVIQVDGVTLTDPATGLGVFPVQTTGRAVVHLTLPWGRGHVFHLYATDANVGLLYQHRWHLEEEPTEQANWTSPFTLLGTQSDKWLKGVVIECDTFGQDKTVQVQADEHTVLETFTVNTTGRNVAMIAFPQVRGRVFRFFPVDAHPSRLYSLRPIFDEEPFALTRWETQEIDHDQEGFHTLIEGMITIRSAAAVTLTITTYVNQTGTTVVDTYTIPSTAGAKVKRWVPFNPRKGVLAKYVFTCPADMYLYQEESYVVVQATGGGDPTVAHPFGNSDVDRTRSMVNATLAASRSGGGS